MIRNRHDTRSPKSQSSREKVGEREACEKGDCEALECPLAQKVDAQLDLEKVTKS